MKLGDFRAAKADCDSALADNDKYVKALMRRILCLEKLEEERASTSGGEGDDGPKKVAAERGSAPSLGPAKAEDFLKLALEDCARWQQLEPHNSAAEKKKSELETLQKQKEEALKEEVMGKLKDLGNNILGKFGLSLDNFKAEKDPATGSYSINFKK